MKHLLCLLLLLPQLALATVVTVNWTPALKFTDGTTESASDIGSSTVQYGTCSTTTPLSVATIAGTFMAQGGLNHAQSPDLPPGTYCFQVITNSLTQGSSDPSNAVKDVIAANPGAPALTSTGNQLVTTGTAVYLATQVPDGWAFTQVGTVPVGTPCDPTQGVNTMNVVPQKNITVAWQTAVQPLSILALCH